MREVINTVLYLNRTGCQWDTPPHDLLSKSTAYELLFTAARRRHMADIRGCLADPNPRGERSRADAQRRLHRQPIDRQAPLEAS